MVVSHELNLSAQEGLSELENNLLFSEITKNFKWNSDKENLAVFLAKRLNINVNGIQISTNSLSTVFKMANAKVNSYHSNKNTTNPRQEERCF